MKVTYKEYLRRAAVAELVDAQRWGRCGLTPVEVRVFSAAPFLVSQLNYSIDLQAYYLQQSTWVDNMVDKYNTSYIYQKRGVYYFSKQLPCELRFVLLNVHQISFMQLEGGQQLESVRDMEQGSR